ncbi:hypothetical protein [Dongia deserti]|uniref:hypothetical protein n=1 Tax=Dongia deserti TaxID=2268030 RepID=UPI000E65D7F7|nr:hypothetical protein [Dongia deserti]
MRNMALSADASFHEPALRWTKSELPISLPWRSVLWRAIVPALWVWGWSAWLWVMTNDNPGRSLIAEAWLFMGMPLIFGLSLLWWVHQWLHRRQAGTLVINDDYLEWQSEMGSNVDLLSDCGPFAVTGKRKFEARIEWDTASSWDGGGHEWPQWTRKWLKPDRTLYARDLGLDRGALESLCKLLNQLREEARAQA